MPVTRTNVSEYAPDPLPQVLEHPIHRRAYTLVHQFPTIASARGSVGDVATATEISRIPSSALLVSSFGVLSKRVEMRRVIWANGRTAVSSSPPASAKAVAKTPVYPHFNHARRTQWPWVVLHYPRA